jgi:hypothetical protein
MKTAMLVARAAMLGLVCSWEAAPTEETITVEFHFTCCSNLAVFYIRGMGGVLSKCRIVEERRNRRQECYTAVDQQVRS